MLEVNDNVSIRRKKKHVEVPIVHLPNLDTVFVHEAEAQWLG